MSVQLVIKWVHEFIETYGRIRSVANGGDHAKSRSRTQVDKLGERLRKGDISGPDLLLLEEYRLTFSEAYQAVVATIRLV